MAASDQAQFESLIQDLMSSDNKIRLKSEETYEGMQPASRVSHLFEAMRNQVAAFEVRSMAAVLLRRLFSSSFDEFWKSFPAEVQAQLKGCMLVLIQNETNPLMRKKICECVAELVRNLVDGDGNNHWPEFVHFIFELALSNNPHLKESALLIFSIVPSMMGNNLQQHLDHIKQMLMACITEQNTPAVRLLAAKASVSFLVTEDLEANALNHFKDLLPFIIQQVLQSVEGDEDDSLLKSVIDLVEYVPKFVKYQLDMFFNMTFKLMANTELSDQIRQLSLEAMVTLAETSPAILKKHPKVIHSLVSQIMEMMVVLEEEEGWAFDDKEEDEAENDTISMAAENSLDRLACGLGGKTMLPYVTSSIPALLQSPDWKRRHAGLMAVSSCGEGCHAQMENVLESIVDAVVPFLNDAHPKVRYAACNAFGQMASDFQPNFEKKFHAKVIPGLLTAIDANSAFPRVQAHACAALVNFSEDCPKAILITYLDVIMTHLEKVLNAKFTELVEKGNMLVLEQVVTALASAADTVEDNFAQYYDRFMPCLKYIFQNANATELRRLRGKTIECISLIGLAVGKEKFMVDCNEVMQLLLKTQSDNSEMADDDPQISYMISAWARICKIMGREFQQYLPFVMAPVLKAASLKPEVAVLDSDDMKVMDDQTDWQFVQLGEQQNFGIRTSGLEEKATAMQMLVCYARELKEGFAEYTEQVVKLMVYNLKFYYHDGVRVAAAESLPPLLDCAQIKGAEYLRSMWQYICPELLKAIDDDTEMAVRAEEMDALALCIEKMGAGCLSEEQMKQLVDLLSRMLLEHFERQEAKLHQKNTDEDYDEETEMLEEDDYILILGKVADVLHSLFGTHKEAFLPFFEQLLPLFVKLINSKRWSDQQWGICIFDDLIEYAGPSSQAYSQHFVGAMVAGLGGERCEVRQAAAYGFGVMAQFGGACYNNTCTEVLPLLTKLIQNPDSRDPKNTSATENLISAFGKICRYSTGNINLVEAISLWFSWLPITEDSEEAIHIYDYVCQLIQTNNPVILGDNNSNLPRILSLFAQTFHLELIDPKTGVGERMVGIIRQLQTNQQIFQACVAPLSETYQKTLMSVLS